MHVLVAPDKFKGSMSAIEVADHIVRGLGVPAITLPVADGGDGTVDAVVAHGYDRIYEDVIGPNGTVITASYGYRDRSAVVELAEASGLKRLASQAPLTASSFGTGQLIKAAAERGAERLVLGLGGSACTDGGSGMMRALGVRLMDAAGHDLPLGGAALTDLNALTIPGQSQLEVVVASDVDNALLGDAGAAAVYGPQKGASLADVAILEVGLTRWAEVVERELKISARDRKAAGAAGGVGFAAMAFLNAEIRSGIDLLLDLVRFREHLKNARLVITGEGSLDAQTLRGKAPAGVARIAAREGIPVVAVAGRCTLNARELDAAGIRAAYALTDLEPDVEHSMTHAGPLLERVATRIAREWLS